MEAQRFLREVNFWKAQVAKKEAEINAYLSRQEIIKSNSNRYFELSEHEKMETLFHTLVLPEQQARLNILKNMVDNCTQLYIEKIAETSTRNTAPTNNMPPPYSLHKSSDK